MSDMGLEALLALQQLADKAYKRTDISKGKKTDTGESYQDIWAKVKKEQEDKEKKKTYEVTIKTTITRTYTIDADTEQGAIEQATENPNDYDSEDINEETEVLDINDYA